ncbi:NF-kappa-B inhibitor cactus-like [Coccinella septempunctata]|uniref:NF-kappa-B inhibitor cactus-like n=1 Tax=Coccinella septempunctata TaxID=41139 RepID=UPI001D070515|nr:NF-kappa-B inhibitor cactus-like [Coccinella septempunctata]
MYGVNSSLSGSSVADECAKIEARPIDSGFLSSSDISDSENFTSEQLSAKSEFSDYFVSGNEVVEDGNMKVDNRVYFLSESLSKIKVEGSCTNDLSSDKSATEDAWGKKNKGQFILQDEHGNTHLHLAIYFCYSDMAFNLIRAAISPVYLDLLDQDGQSPLHLAVATNQYQIVRSLIVAGAHPGIRNSKGDSPLHIAARLGYYNCCRAILEPVRREEFKSLCLSYDEVHYKMVDLEQWNYEGQTCAHIAALNCHIDILRLLMRCGADINAREGRGGYTILHFAIQNKMEKLAYFLLSECSNLEADVTTYAGKSVLQLGLPINTGLSRTLLLRGAASPYSSEDEDMEECEDEVLKRNNHLYLHNSLLNGCA